jgi:ureidoacrylate peracid hydrolase
MNTLTREVPIDPAYAAMLIIDVQNYCVGAKGEKNEFFGRSLRDFVLPNIRRLQAACRVAGIEVVYSVIENMTRDGRDRSLDYKISGIDVPRGSWDAQVLAAIARRRTKWSSARPRAASSSRPISITCCAISAYAR